MQSHNVKRQATGEYFCSCGRQWDADEGDQCPGRAALVDFTTQGEYRPVTQVSNLPEDCARLPVVGSQVIGRVYAGVAELNSIGRSLDGHAALVTLIDSQALIAELRVENERLKDGAHRDGLLRVQYGKEFDKLRAQFEQLQAAPAELRIVLDAPPGPESGRFVEVENERGRSVNAGEWRQRADGLWELVIKRSAPAEQPGQVVAWRITGAGALTVTPEYPKWAESDERLKIEALVLAPAQRQKGVES